MLGKLQRRILRAFIAEPGRKTTAELVRWCYPRLTGPILGKHRYCVRIAAQRVAVRVGRTYPGGFIWEAKAEHSSAQTEEISAQKQI
jgi:hypothetical protein